jgi:D-amino-acid dehydrogenase
MRIVVVGAGIIGLAVAYHLVKEGTQVAVIDRDPEGDKCSVGNAGAIAVTEIVPAATPSMWRRLPGWMLDPLGPLTVRPARLPKLLPWLIAFAKAAKAREVNRISQALCAINARAYDDWLPVLKEIGLVTELHRHGALSIYESDRGFGYDAEEWACKRAHGIECHELTGNQAREMEPALSTVVHRAMFTPQWSYVSDPKTVLKGIREWLIERGVEIVRAKVHKVAGSDPSAVIVETDGGLVRADRAVIAAGAWSGILARKLGDRVLLESERGYNMTIPDPGVAITRQLIFAERKFVASPLSCGLRIGGAAEFGGLNAKPNFKRSRALVALAQRYLPKLRTDGGTAWCGHRPATPDSLPVIGPSKHVPHVYYVFGNGHLGLTQAATTGRLISEMIFGMTASIPVAPYDIGRF